MHQKRLRGRRGKQRVLLRLLALLQVFLVDFEDTAQVGITLKLLKRAESLDLTLFEDTDAISQVQEVDGVGYQDSSFIF